MTRRRASEPRRRFFDRVECEIVCIGMGGRVVEGARLESVFRSKA